MSTALTMAWDLLEQGEVPGVLRHLRGAVDDIAMADLARLVGRVAATMPFDDLVTAADRLAAAPDEPQQLYDFGYACIERGVSFLAIPALTAALRQVPDSGALLAELVTALEDEQRHAEAVAVLADRAPTLPDWPQRYLLVFNAVMAGDLDLARHHLALLAEPDDPRWLPAHARVRRMLDRAAVVDEVSPLHRQDLRGWHFVLTGGVLTTLSPYGFTSMTGRYGYLQDGDALCLLGLRRLRSVLEAADRRPRAVALLPDRSSTILGLAAAELLGLPTEPFGPAMPDTLVVAYDLDGVDPDLLSVLHDRAPGQVLFAHATDWTDPPAVTADVTTLLYQAITPPWGERLGFSPDGQVRTDPADDRPAEVVAAELLGANPEYDKGDGETPADPDGLLTRFVTTVAARWLVGPRERVRSAGPVPSARFF